MPEQALGAWHPKWPSMNLRSKCWQFLRLTVLCAADEELAVSALDALALRMVGCLFMVSAIPFFSISLLRRAALAASVFLLPLVDCRDVVYRESNAAATTNTSTSGETARSAYDFINSIGLNTHLNYFDRIYGNFPLVQRELKSIGVRHVRDGVHLQNADYNAALYDRWIQLGKMGVRFNAVLDPRSNLGSLNGALLDEVESLSGQTIESFEGPNEMDVSNESDWTAVDQGYQGLIFTSDRSMNGTHPKVIGPSLAFASNGTELGSLTNRIDEGNLHPYPAGKAPSVVFPEQVDLEKVVSDGKPIVFTESGYHNAVNERHDQPGVSESAAAKYVPRLFLEDFSRGIPRTYLYEFMDEAPEPAMTDPQMHWGLIRADGSEKPAFTSLKNMIQVLEDSTEESSPQQLGWKLSDANDQIHHVLLQKSDGTFYLVLWQETSSYDLRHNADIDNADVAETLTLTRTARSVSVYEPMEGTAAVHSWDSVSSVPISIPDHPLIVEIGF